jgi:hypothetical protein
MHLDRVAGVAAVLMLAACGGLFGPRPSDTFLMLDPVQIIVGLPDPRPPLAVLTYPGEVAATGWLTTATPCYGFAPQSARAQRVLVVTLVIRAEGEGCVQSLQHWAFRVSVRDVPAGTWDVRVRAEYGRGTVVDLVRASVVVP